MKSYYGTSFYQNYITSKEWYARKKRLIKQRGHICEGKCKRTYVFLELSHKTYVRLGNELDSDLELLCQQCHAIKDSQAIYENAFHSYVNTKYNHEPIPESIHEEFYEWLLVKKICKEWSRRYWN